MSEAIRLPKPQAHDGVGGVLPRYQEHDTGVASSVFTLRPLTQNSHTSQTILFFYVLISRVFK